MADQTGTKLPETGTEFRKGAPLVFEPHNLFRSNAEGEEWPLGYISSGYGCPRLELHEVLGDEKPETLIELARGIVAKVNACGELIACLQAEIEEYDGCDEIALVEWLGEAMGRRIIRARIAVERANAPLPAPPVEAAHG